MKCSYCGSTPTLNTWRMISKTKTYCHLCWEKKKKWMNKKKIAQIQLISRAKRTYEELSSAEVLNPGQLDTMLLAMNVLIYFNLLDRTEEHIKLHEREIEK